MKAFIIVIIIIIFGRVDFDEEDWDVGPERERDSWLYLACFFISKRFIISSLQRSR